MGYLRHECVVVSGWNAGNVLIAHAAASGIFSRHGLGAIVGGLTHHAINGGAAFLIAPDGSKEGWEASDNGAAARAEFIAWLKEKRQFYGVDFALLVMGGDDNEFRVAACTLTEEEV